MRKIKVEDAVGKTLCHDMTAILENGFKGVKFKRGHVIRPEDIDVLLDMGKSHIFIWEENEDEVHEEDAARALAQVICSQRIEASGPVEGKFTLRSKTDGLFQTRTDALKAINSVEDFTVAAIQNNSVVKAGDTLCGLRIVPLTTKRENVGKAVEIAKEHAPVFDVLPFLPLQCGLIITGSEIYNGRIKDAFEPILRKKIARFGGQVIDVAFCPDDESMVLAAIEKQKNSGANVIFLTGGMSVDPDDITPSAIRHSGAQIIAKGVPIQPGNMLHIAYLSQTVLLGVPGASMHSPVTSLDVFLPRIFAGVKINAAEIADYGNGGLCGFCDTCTYPHCSFCK